MFKRHDDVKELDSLIESFVMRLNEKVGPTTSPMEVNTSLSRALDVLCHHVGLISTVVLGNLSTDEDEGAAFEAIMQRVNHFVRRRIAVGRLHGAMHGITGQQQQLNGDFFFDSTVESADDTLDEDVENLLTERQ